MCYTIHIRTSRDAIEKRFQVDTSALNDFQFSYFYKAFTNPLVPVITQNEPGKVNMMRWGLIPHWSKDKEHAEAIRKGTYNARGETLDKKPAFRSAYENNRCWIIANGFFEWQQRGKNKIPWFLQRVDQRIFAIAGIFDSWHDPLSNTEYKTFSLVTTKANPLLQKIHNTKKRMPLILDETLEEKWINPIMNSEDVSKIMLSLDETLLSAYTISNKIASPDADPEDSNIISRVDYPSENTLF